MREMDKLFNELNLGEIEFVLDFMKMRLNAYVKGLLYNSHTANAKKHRQS